MFTYRDYLYQVERHRDHIARGEQRRWIDQVEQIGLRSKVEQSDRRSILAVAVNDGLASLGRRMLSAKSGHIRLDPHTK